nr:GNAT family N-acetyltransferase [Companilactobacillus ginsenosidimutans]
MLRSKKQYIEFIGFFNNGKLVGTAYNMSKGDLTYIFYLAVNPELRGGGYGSKILKDIVQMYAGHRFCLSAEKPDSKAANAEQRERRIAFYKRNGFNDFGKVAVEDGVTYTMLSYGDADFEKQEYIDLQAYFSGIFTPFAKIKFIDEEQN